MEEATTSAASQCAVLLNDMQYDLVNKNEDRRAAVSKALPGISRTLDAFRSQGVLVVHMQLILREDDAKAERFEGRLPCQKGTSGARVLDQLLNPRDEVVEKNKDSAFYESDLDSLLKSRSINTTIVAGMQTQICVQTTAADAYFRGYNVIVASDLVISARAEDKARALAWLGSYCATVTTSSELLSCLAAGGVPQYRAPVIP